MLYHFLSQSWDDISFASKRFHDPIEIPAANIITVSTEWDNSRELLCAINKYSHLQECLYDMK